MKILLLVMLLAIGGCSKPDFFDTNGNGYRVSDFEGSWQVINYWATWCAPCIKEIPELVELGEKHDDIAVFGVNYDAPEAEEMAAQIERMKITFPVYQIDPRERLGIERPVVLPTTVLVNPEGTVVEILIGPQTEASLLAVMGKSE
jgi:thiol-disulfide isomerase/thioredoxin